MGGLTRVNDVKESNTGSSKPSTTTYFGQPVHGPSYNVPWFHPAYPREYNLLWESDPTKYVQTMDEELASGKITQEFYDDSFSRDKQRRDLRDTHYKQQEAKAKRERELAEQQAALRESQEKARKAAQQQRTLQGLESVDETSGEVVAVSGGGASETEESRGRRRRGGRLSAVLGI